MKELDYVLNNEREVLTFLKSKYPLYHLSNVFFRDIQYGIQVFLIRKKMEIGYSDAEKIAREFVAQLEKKKILSPIDKQTWVLQYPEFKKPITAPALAAKPAPAARPTSPAAALPRPAALPPLKSGTSAATRPPLPPLNRPAAGAPKPASAPAVAVQPQAVPAEAPASATKTVEVPAPTPKPVSPTPAPASSPAGTRKPLPPIKSSTPAGSKK
ncbi:MAG: hypothetical protein HW407_1446 [Bacteroidetes bacterium]|nr:hypothetical protein [Bacteroidota bacterium]